ncbi:MAG TPA: elongation factor P maturation arginine rhamnosyltransferase EarP [Gammaproteobacteria bacterium]
MSTSPRWDIFCSVIDNFGDIGVCWRLARQLAGEHALQVRLWVDDLASFRRMAPIDPALDSQWLQGVEVRRWGQPFGTVATEEIADVVVEAFGCPLPESYERAMALRSPKPFWLNLEHLTAEGWIEGCHTLTSPHPRLPLIKHFFFPGFTPASGGLLREQGLLKQVRAFQEDGAAQARFWEMLGVPAGEKDELRISLFAYGSRALAGLLHAWRDGATPIRCLIPEGGLATEAAQLLGREGLGAGAEVVCGNLRLQIFPFLDQAGYDRLLWGCDLNFVRGEDSFVRAQWAMRPMVWQPYRQEEHHHDVKLEAFLQRYRAGLPSAAGQALVNFWQAWNREEGVAEAWGPFLAQRQTLARHASGWANELASHPDLATNLVHFTQKPL